MLSLYTRSMHTTRGGKVSPYTQKACMHFLNKNPDATVSTKSNNMSTGPTYHDLCIHFADCMIKDFLVLSGKGHVPQDVMCLQRTRHIVYYGHMLIRM